MENSDVKELEGSQPPVENSSSVTSDECTSSRIECGQGDGNNSFSVEKVVGPTAEKSKLSEASTSVETATECSRIQESREGIMSDDKSDADNSSAVVSESETPKEERDEDVNVSKTIESWKDTLEEDPKVNKAEEELLNHEENNVPESSSNEKVCPVKVAVDQEPMHTSPSTATEPGAMEVEDATRSGAPKENEEDMNLDDDKEEANIDIDKGTEDDGKPIDEEHEENISQDDEASMNLDDHPGETSTSMNMSEGVEEDQSMDQDTQQENTEFVHVDSKEKDGADTMSMADVSQSGEESMEVSSPHDEDPFGVANDSGDKHGDMDEPMEVEEPAVAEKLQEPPEIGEKPSQDTNDDKEQEIFGDKEQVSSADKEQVSSADKEPVSSADKEQVSSADKEQVSSADKEQVSSADKEQEINSLVGPDSNASGKAKDMVVEDKSVSEKSDETSETITGDKQSDHVNKNPETEGSLDNSVPKDLEEEICIIPDTVPRILTSSESSRGREMVGTAKDSRTDGRDIGSVSSDMKESNYRSGKDSGMKESRGKHREGQETPRGRKSSVKSIDEITERIQDRSSSIESLKDSSKPQRTPGRPQRQAAKKAESQIKELAEEDSNSNDGDIQYRSDKVIEVEATLQMCFQCCRVRSCRYQVFIAGRARHLCQEECFAAFRKESGIKSSKSGLILNEGNASSGGSKEQSFIRKCAQCSSVITGDEKNLSWETMDYCNEECLGKYQTRLGSHCANCKGAVQPASLGKYCVRFGYDIKQFCCSSCLEEFKKGLKVCSYCQKDISSGTEGFLAPVGDKGQFKDFCTQACMEKYDQMSNNQPAPMVMHQCAVCNNEKMVKVEVIHNKVLNKLCSEPCFAAFKFVNAIVADQCDMCKKYFDKTKTDVFSVFYDDAAHSFCCKTCMNVYILANRKIVPCNWCKVKKYNFDMIKRVTNAGQVLMMCSLNCLTLYQVSVSAVSSKRIRCDMCNYVAQAQYHLTMSDATIRNFCTYDCVADFQKQYGKNTPLAMSGSDPTPIPTGAPKRAYARRSMPLTQNENQIIPGKTTGSSMPVISNVTSLAPNGQQPSTPNSTGITTRSAALKMNNNNIPQNQSENALQVVYKELMVVKPPPPKVMRNKSVLCKPYMHTKGISCRPHPCAKETQTEAVVEKPILIPVPVPIYVPAPMHMYCSPFPVPVPFPLPVPVPIFIPTTRNSANGIIKEIKRIQEKIPTDPFEAELLMMAEMVAGEKKAEISDSESDDGGNEAGDVSEVPGASSTAEGGFSPEAVDTSNTFGEDMLQMALKMASELEEPAVDLEAALTPSTITAQSNTSMEQNDATESEDDPEPVASIATEARAAIRGRKRSIRTSRGSQGGVPSKRGRRISSSVDILPPPEPTGAQRIEQEKPDANMCLKYTFGVNAWKQWVMTKNSELEKAATNNRKIKLFKPEILQLTADELNYSLCLFVKEVRKPNGSEYAPDTIYYLCLGIQQYLFENGRIDNIFTDSYYEKFTECLDEVAKKFSVLYNDSQYIVTRVEEEHLWESKQLGAHSPHVLLSTLMFFNTKHFNLTTVDEHMQLSFSHIMKHWKRNPNQPGVTKVPGSSRNVLLRFYPPQSSLEANSRKKKVYEQQENEDNPLRCPVKLYEFYLSKCPESVKTRNDVFYLLPERSCVPDSPVWYSTMALGKEPLVKMLHRVKMVKEINIALLTS